jgi:hypothetical protein
MKSTFAAGAALALVLLLAGCDSTSGITARIQEKSTAFAQLTPAQKKNIEGGEIEIGFTTDMVYMALGKASKVKEKTAPEGTVVMWTYNNYFPSVAVSALTLNDPSRQGYRTGQTSPNAPRSASGIADTRSSGPEPSVDSMANIPSETLHVFFLNGVVFDIKLEST